MSRNSLVICYVPTNKEVDDLSVERYTITNTRATKILSDFFGEEGKNFLKIKFDKKEDRPSFKIFIPNEKIENFKNLLFDPFNKRFEKEAFLILKKKMK